jgi:hypothetical protein
MAGINVTGVAGVTRMIGKAKVETGKRIEDITQKSLEIIGNKADEMCPVETGKMKATKTITVTGKGFGCRGTISYGGPSAPYTLYVHEDLTADHDWPEQAKWLEKAMRMTKGTRANMAKRVIKEGTYRIFNDDSSRIQGDADPQR